MGANTRAGVNYSRPRIFIFTLSQLCYRVANQNGGRHDETNRDKIDYILTISAKKIALFVHVESDAVDFVASDNFFPLEPGESRAITLRIEDYPKSSEEISEDVIIKSFQVKSLFDLRA